MVIHFENASVAYGAVVCTSGLGRYTFFANGHHIVKFCLKNELNRLDAVNLMRKIMIKTYSGWLARVCEPAHRIVEESVHREPTSQHQVEYKYKKTPLLVDLRQNKSEKYKKHVCGECPHKKNKQLAKQIILIQQVLWNVLSGRLPSQNIS